MIKTLATDGNEEPSRLGLVQLVTKSKDLSWCKVMRKAGLNGIWIDDLAYDFARLAIAGRIEKNYRTSPAYLFSEFGRQLVNANDVR